MVKIGENVTIYHGDCLEIMKSMSPKKIDMVLCDLPYGTTSCKWDIVIPFEPLWRDYESLVDGPIILFGKQPFTSSLVLSNLRAFKYELIWEKDKPTNFVQANKQPMCYHENILVFYTKQPVYNKQMVQREGKGTWRYNYDISHENRKMQGTSEKYSGKTSKSNYDADYKNPKSILYFDTGRRQNSIHPTQKPVSLLEWLILTYSNENDTILDNCMGSGSTGVACINTNRKFVGIEKDDKYFEIAKDRIEECLKNQ